MTNISKQDQEEIQRRLDKAEQEHNIRILFAIESGSRAWGFPSPDSDYDVRFVYVHELDWYLDITPQRDVIEQPIELPFDINGWDLKKALSLLVKANPVLLEWLQSPFWYRRDERAVSMLKALVDKLSYQKPCCFHYFKLAKSGYKQAIQGHDHVALKKYFYVIRPILALRWLRLHTETPPPMSLPELRAGTELPADFTVMLDGLLEQKRQTREMGKGLRIVLLDQFIEAELDRAEAALTNLEANTSVNSLISQANEVFRSLVKLPALKKW